MFRTNDPFWSRQAAREGLMGQNTGPEGLWGWKRARAGACMAVTDSQIGLFMKQSQTDFMNSPG
jgi:hypothetical protein